jgi:hypothetical protein
MQTESPKVDPPKRKRRWFQFSLRTLMIGVTLFCVVDGGYVGWQAKIVRARRAWLAHLATQRYQARIGDRVIYAGNGHGEPSIVRRWLGDKAILRISLPATVPDEDRETTLRLFPESNVTQTSIASERPATKP